MPPLVLSDLDLDLDSFELVDEAARPSLETLSAASGRNDHPPMRLSSCSNCGSGCGPACSKCNCPPGNCKR